MAALMVLLLPLNMVPPHTSSMVAHSKGSTEHHRMAGRSMVRRLSRMGHHRNHHMDNRLLVINTHLVPKPDTDHRVHLCRTGNSRAVILNRHRTLARHPRHSTTLPKGLEGLDMDSLEVTGRNKLVRVYLDRSECW